MALKPVIGGLVDIPSVEITEAPEDGKQYARQDGAWVEVEAASAAPTELMLEEDYVLPAPEGTFSGGDKVKYHIHAIGADRNLKFGNNIAIPTDSTFDNSFGKTLLENRVYVVQLEYLCSSQWGLTTLVGGYY